MHGIVQLSGVGAILFEEALKQELELHKRNSIALLKAHKYKNRNKQTYKAQNVKTGSLDNLIENLIEKHLKSKNDDY